MSEETAKKEEPVHRWWIRYVAVPMVTALVAAVTIYIATRKGTPETKPNDAQQRLNLQERHDKTARAIANRDLLSALTDVEIIIHEFPTSAKAHYNLACVYALLAEEASDNIDRQRRLTRSEEALRQSLSFGILSILTVEGGDSNPRVSIRSDPDLEILFAEQEGASLLLNASSSEAGSMITACVSPEMNIRIPSGRAMPAKLVVNSLAISSWHESSERKGTVTEKETHTVEYLLRINGRLLISPSQQVMTDSDWLPAGELEPGVSKIQSVDGLIGVESVDVLRGEFEVISLIIKPYPTMIVEGIVLHNKVLQAP